MNRSNDVDVDDRPNARTVSRVERARLERTNDDEREREDALPRDSRPDVPRRDVSSSTRARPDRLVVPFPRALATSRPRRDEWITRSGSKKGKGLVMGHHSSIRWSPPDLDRVGGGRVHRRVMNGGVVRRPSRAWMISRGGASTRKFWVGLMRVVLRATRGMDAGESGRGEG